MGGLPLLPVFRVYAIDIKRKYGWLKVCYVPPTNTTFLAFFLSFLLRPLTVLIRQTRQAEHAINQSIFLRYLWYVHKHLLICLLGGCQCVTSLAPNYGRRKRFITLNLVAVFRAPELAEANKEKLALGELQSGKWRLLPMMLNPTH